MSELNDAGAWQRAAMHRSMREHACLLSVDVLRNALQHAQKSHAARLHALESMRTSGQSVVLC